MKENNGAQSFITRITTSIFVILGLLSVLLGTTQHVYAGGAIGSGACNETDLKTAINTGGTVTFSADCTIVLTSEIGISSGVTIDGNGLW